MPNTFNKKEKLKSRKQIDQLFSGSKSFAVFPLKVLYCHPENQQDFPVKAGVGVGSRYFKKAVLRNRIKRITREAYRLHKQPLIDWAGSNGKNITLFILYIDKTMPPKGLLQRKMPGLIQRLIQEMNETNIENS